MKRSDFPLYEKGLEAYLSGGNERLSAVLADANLSRSEWKLLKARRLMKDHAYEEARVLLEEFEPADGSFFAGEKWFLLSNYNCYVSRWQHACAANHEALRHYQICGDRRGLFLSNYNLSVDYGRLSLGTLEQAFLSKARSFAETDRELALVFRAQACLYAKENRFDLAEKELAKGFARIDQLSPVDAVNFSLIAASIRFQSGNWEGSLKLLESLKSAKALRDRARVHFEAAVIRSLIDIRAGHEPLPLKTTSAFLEDSTEYRLKWEILRSIQDGEKDIAHGKWAELVKEFPQKYDADLAVCSEAEANSAFILLLRRLLQSKVTHSSPELSGKAALLYRLLSESPMPLRKEFLIEQVWGELYDPSLDARFYKLLERLKKVGGIKIINRNRAYALARTGS